MSHDLTDFRETLARLLGASLVSLFPGVVAQGGGVTTWGFYYDFSFPVPFQKEYLRLAQDKMKELLGQKSIFEQLEMVPQNGAAYLDHLNQPYLAQKARLSESPTITLMRIGEFVDLCPPIEVEESWSLENVKLFESVEREGRLRLFGAAFSSRDELKQFLKQKRPYFKETHINGADELDLFTCVKEGVAWRSAGRALKELLYDLWKKEHQLATYSLTALPSLQNNNSHYRRLQILQQMNEARVADFSYGEFSFERMEGEGILSLPKGESDLALQICDEHEVVDACKSSLQLIIKILNMLGFEPDVVLCPNGSYNYASALREALHDHGVAFRESKREQSRPRIEIMIPDGMGRLWVSSYLEIQSPNVKQAKDKRVIVAHSVFVSIERIIALLIEWYKGKLPFWMKPEQVLLVEMTLDCRPFVETLYRELVGKQYRVVVQSADVGGLAAAIHQATKKQIPYVGIIGPRELETETVSLRALDSQTKRNVDLKQLIETLQQEENIEN